MKPHKLIAAGLFVASFSLYISTLAPSVATIFDDSLEFQLVTYQLGIAHPTGYPLYTLLGKLFTFIPIGNVAYRVNLMSAFFGAATVALTYLIVLQMAIPRQKKSGFSEFSSAQNSDDAPNWPTHLGGVIGALLLAGGLVFWQQATIAEVYTLNAFFVAAILVQVTGIYSQNKVIQPNSAAPITQRIPLSDVSLAKSICWTALLIGLSLTHHRTMLLIVPALALYLYLNFGTALLKPKLLVLGLLCSLLPLLLYLYLPWRGHIGSLDGTYQNSWPGFWRQVSASGYGLFIVSNPFGHERDFVFYWNLLADQFYTTIPGLIGLVYLMRIGRPRYLALTGLAFLTYLPFNLFYNVTDIEVFFIPIFLLWAIWSGVGAAFLIRTAARLRVRSADPQPPAAESYLGSKTKSDLAIEFKTEEFGASLPQVSPAKLTAAEPLKQTHWRAAVPTVIIAIFVLIISQLFQANLIRLRERYSWQVHDYGLDILQQPVPTDEAAIVGILGEMTLLRYFQETENRRTDIETVTADLESDRLAAVEALLASGKTVYLTRELAGTPERWSLNAIGPLIRLDPEAVTQPPEISHTLNRPVTAEITLLGYNMSRAPHTGHGAAPVRFTLYWQTNASIAADLKVSTRLLTSAGKILAAVDAVPVHFAYPTTAWRSGEIVSDVYDLSLPSNTPSGQYNPLIIWYDPAQNAAEVGRVALEAVSIE